MTNSLSRYSDGITELRHRTKWQTLPPIELPTVPRLQDGKGPQPTMLAAPTVRRALPDL
jgi:hypothetical protein